MVCRVCVRPLPVDGVGVKDAFQAMPAVPGLLA
jgi:hypothetical protein